MRILVFDSGLGGLSILREVRSVLPRSNISYLADDAAFPYGNWQSRELVKRIEAVIEVAIEEHDPQLVIIACNTATTLALDNLRQRFAMPFVGTVPAIKPAAEQTASGLVSVLATPGTVKRQYTHDLISEFAGKINVRLIGSATLAIMAEKYLITGKVDRAEIGEQISPCFMEVEGKRTDIVVLACTHYPFLINEFRKCAPWPVDWLDTAHAIALQAKNVAPPQSEIDKIFEFDHACFTSNNPSDDLRKLVAGFGLKIKAGNYPPLV